ncbi:N-acetylglucosaminyldiphosphoundecaprenol N-acetyl-beta-D-mannosaminyltransferase [Flavobacterium gillisiae]|uniref:N-acetylglucosaminyldiphosphoundecaprenol N-acetyl-beta-D-mannosaminyltransferase n=1 Tax=Flavobacterium gillisiae TaxID=150146 RepID=A0A1H3ZQ36_9FLAO|nr:WecB/TagA/CpsF family glycosyltransferase [Flavobacterium gillisiae]SEA25886.1 N-acetylglucosaminyldiphosphoundecaprenol N-acetyl-beta-D-mannosaminyltransferase [Flavobacterium gillisiae]
MTTQVPTVSLAEFSVFSGDLCNVSFKGKTLINTLNQYSFCIAKEDKEFKASLVGSDILLADGMAIVVASSLLRQNKIKKIAGADLHQFLLEDLNTKGGSCFYLGSSPTTLLKIEERMKMDFPNVIVKTFSPAFKPEFSIEDNEQMLAEVNAFKPDVLFVGMTAPKQEKWAHQHKDALEAKIICSIGAVFDFYAGTVERPHPFWIQLRLEWFIRLIKEPKRMWKRYLYYGPVFIKLIILEKFKK